MKHMEAIDSPEYLYHYTSLDKLALILKNRTIRLNPLNKMDDLQEKRGKDIRDIGKFVFVSSWTASAVESIPMWKMYTDSTRGVRIKLKSNPFSKCQTSMEDMRRCLKNMRCEGDGCLDTFLNLAELIACDIFSPEAWNGSILYPVEYTEDISLLEPQITAYTGKGIEISLDAIGKYKNRGWEFQQEWRYIMRFFKVPFSEDLDKIPEALLQIAVGISNSSEPAPIDYFDLPIEPACFSNMEIMASPHLSLGNKILLEALIEKYNPDAKLVESQYKGLL